MGKKEIASLISGSLILIYHSRETGPSPNSTFNPLPDYSKSIKYSYHQLMQKKINDLELKRSHLHSLWLKIFSQHGKCAVLMMFHCVK